MSLEFNFKYKDYELRACPKRLVRFSPEEPNETIDLVKWDRSGVKPYCFSLAYFVRESEGYKLYFVGNRPFEYIDTEDLTMLWGMLGEAQKILDLFCEEDGKYD